MQVLLQLLLKINAKFSRFYCNKNLLLIKVQCNIPTLEALLRKNMYLFLERCRRSNIAWLSALTQSDCLSLSLFFQHYNRILLCDWVLERHCLITYGCLLRRSQIVYIRPYSLNTTTAFYFVTEYSDITVFVRLRVCMSQRIRTLTGRGTFVCQFMWWLKFQYKHVTVLISCQFNRTVSFAVSGCFHVHFPTEELRLICLLAVIEEHDEFSKKYRWFFIYLTAQTSEPSVLASNFYKLIADFCISKIQFCCSCFFRFLKKSYTQYI